MSNKITERDIEIIKKSLDYYYNKIEKVSKIDGLSEIVKNDLTNNLVTIAETRSR